MTPPTPAERSPADESWIGAVRLAFAQTPRAVRLVWSADPYSTLGLLILQAVGALLPLAIAWVGKLLVDSVVEAARTEDPAAAERALTMVGIELALMVASGLITRATGLLRSLVGTRLAYQIQGDILEKAQTLDLVHFETPEVYDRLQNARREASSRPLNLFTSAVDIGSNAITLASYGVLLFGFSPWTLLILAAATIPSFIAEARFSGQAFRLFTWRAPEGRKMRYLEILLTRDSNAQEVKLYGLGPMLLDRYRGFYQRFFAEDRQLAVRRAVWGFGLGILSTGALYGCYAWIVVRTVGGALTLGDMTLYMTVFRQGQASLRSILKALGSSYEDNLFMSNLFGFLSMPTGPEAVRALFETGEPAKISPPNETAAKPVDGVAAPGPSGPGGDGIRSGERGFVLDAVSFRYPGMTKWALQDVNLHIAPREKLAIVGNNGAGKSTMIKLLTGLYPVTRGQIRLDGVPLEQIDPGVLRGRLGVVVQDFVQYEFTARENVGLGQPNRMDDLDAIKEAARRGGAYEALAGLPDGFETQLGRWFQKGSQLSRGNWQKVAVARAFMRDADILILDEPSAALDAEAEHALFERFRELTDDRMAILISHRFSTVRMADRILVLGGGRVIEIGTHDELMTADGQYAHLFTLQASGLLGDDWRSDEPLARPDRNDSEMGDDAPRP